MNIWKVELCNKSNRNMICESLSTKILLVNTKPYLFRRFVN